MRQPHKKVHVLVSKAEFKAFKLIAAGLDSDMSTLLRRELRKVVVTHSDLLVPNVFDSFKKEPYIPYRYPV